MNTHVDKSQANKSQSAVNGFSQKKSGAAYTFQFVDNRPETIAKRKLHEAMNKSPQALQLRALQSMTNNSLQTNQAALLQNKAVSINDDSVLKREADQLGEMVASESETMVIQRMIRDYPRRREVPNETEGYRDLGFWKELTDYLYFQVINTRGQTFEEAVAEHLKIQSAGKVAELQSTWRGVQSKLNSHSPDIMDDINNLILSINSWEFYNTSHPQQGRYPVGERESRIHATE